MAEFIDPETQGTLDALSRLRRDGDALTEARDVDFSVVLPNEQLGLQFAEDCRRRGYAAHLSNIQNRESLCDIVVTMNLVPSLEAIENVEASLKQIAEPLGGYNDGWGCFCVNDLFITQTAKLTIQ